MDSMCKIKSMPSSKKYMYSCTEQPPRPPSCPLHSTPKPWASHSGTQRNASAEPKIACEGQSCTAVGKNNQTKHHPTAQSNIEKYQKSSSLPPACLSHVLLLLTAASPSPTCMYIRPPDSQPQQIRAARAASPQAVKPTPNSPPFFNGATHCTALSHRSAAQKPAPTHLTLPIGFSLLHRCCTPPYHHPSSL